MKMGSILIGMLLTLVASVAVAQAPPPSDTTASTQTQTPPPTPAPPPPTPAPAPPPPSPPPSTSTATKAVVYRYGAISGSWLRPSGDFDKFAKDGWAITLEGFQFISPTKKIAVGSQIGYQAFGEKNGVTVSNFPVDAVLKFYPKPGTGKADLYVTGGIGFNYQRTDVGHATNSDYYFATQAGVGLQLHGKGPVGFLVDGVYHWVFAKETDTNFIALRGGLTVPMTR